jgi:hypothetical protein
MLKSRTGKPRRIVKVWSAHLNTQRHLRKGGAFCFAMNALKTVLFAALP